MTTASTISYKRGDIVLVSFPFTDLTSAKRRPALVVSPDIFNGLNEDLILLAVTSQLNSFSYSISVLPGDCEEGALPKESMVKLTKVFTLSSALVVKRLCRLGDRQMNAVLAGLRSLYS
jgi:mRNA interferase MazF